MTPRGAAADPQQADALRHIAGVSYLLAKSRVKPTGTAMPAIDRRLRETPGSELLLLAFSTEPNAPSQA